MRVGFYFLGCKRIYFIPFHIVAVTKFVGLYKYAVFSVFFFEKFMDL